MQLDVARVKKLAGQACDEKPRGDSTPAIALLTDAFHGLAEADGLDPWDVEQFYAWSVDHLQTVARRDCAASCSPSESMTSSMRSASSATTSSAFDVSSSASRSRRGTGRT